MVISCNLPGKQLAIVETENGLKEDVIITCSYPAADVRFLYRFHWHGGRFNGKARVIVD